MGGKFADDGRGSQSICKAREATYAMSVVSQHQHYILTFGPVITLALPTVQIRTQRYFTIEIEKVPKEAFIANKKLTTSKNKSYISYTINNY